jgi:aminomethyltransferase
MVPFAGFSMPVHYSGLIEEHTAVRTAAGLFDVSHMGEFEIRGAGAGALLDRVTPSRLSSLEVGRVAYSCLTTEDGTIVDDVLVYRLADEHFLAVVNAANRVKDFAWIEDRAAGLEARLDDASEATALLAIQGPYARKIFAEVAEGFDAMAVKYYRVVEGRACGRSVRASRTGYTGEMGFEVFCAAADAPALWDGLVEAGSEHGLLPAGLGARDSLRLEAGLPLYGNDIDETTTVLEAGLEFIVDWEKEDFVGRDALVAEKERGSKRRRCGFEVTGRGIARHGHQVLMEGQPAGIVTSGTFSPTLQKAIGMAYLPADRSEVGTEMVVDVRGRTVEARVAPLPFYKRPKRSKKGAGSEAKG